MNSYLLNVQDLKTNFYTYEGVVKALDGINFKIEEGKTLGLVGETGCGKSVTVLSILRLILNRGGESYLQNRRRTCGFVNSDRGVYEEDKGK